MNARPFAPKRVLITGDRNWSNSGPTALVVFDAINTLAPDDWVIMGGASGVDSIAYAAASSRDLAIIEIPAQWKRYGPAAAGPIRNKRMLDEGKPTEVWAFHDDLQRSKGPRDMVMQALKAGLQVTVYDSEGSSRVLQGVLA